MTLGSKIYISGPMTGVKDFNFPAFNKLSRSLRELHQYTRYYEEEQIFATIVNYPITVFNPAREFNGRTDLPWSAYMRNDINLLLQSDMIIFLPDGEKSVGVLVEKMVALALGLPCFQYEKAHAPRNGYIIRKIPLDSSMQQQIIIDIIKYSNDTNIIKTIFSPLKVLADSKRTILQEAQDIVHGDRGQDYGHPIKDFTRTAGMWSGLFVDKLKDGAKFEAKDVPLAMNCVKMSREMNHPKRDNRVDGAGYWETLDMVVNHAES